MTRLRNFINRAVVVRGKSMRVLEVLNMKADKNRLQTVSLSLRCFYGVNLRKKLERMLCLTLVFQLLFEAVASCKLCTVLSDFGTWRLFT